MDIFILRFIMKWSMCCQVIDCSEKNDQVNSVYTLVFCLQAILKKSGLNLSLFGVPHSIIRHCLISEISICKVF